MRFFPPGVWSHSSLPSTAGRAEPCLPSAAACEYSDGDHPSFGLLPRFRPSGCTVAPVLSKFVAARPGRPRYFRYRIYRSTIRPADWLRPTVM